MSDYVPFNMPTFLGTEFDYIHDAIGRSHISGDGFYSKKCHELLATFLGCSKALLTNSCSAALEMAALGLDIQAGDEVICPSYTFVTSASSFVLRGAKIVFVDIKSDTLNLDETKLEAAITERTKAIVVVHYAGVSCEMDSILDIAQRHGLKVVEDCAQAIGSQYKGRPCGSMGCLSCLSFHETKNVVCGEGGALLINDPSLIELAEVIREKGTNRSKFFRGQVDKYTWVGLGSSYLPSDMAAAYLYPQLLALDKINTTRLALWQRYHEAFAEYERQGAVIRPYIPQNCRHNAHMYFLRFGDLATRTRFIKFMEERGISTVFHYIPLHSSPAGLRYGRVEGTMHVTDHVSDTLVRLPLFHSLSFVAQDKVIESAKDFLEAL